MKSKLATTALCAAGLAMPAFAGDAEDVKATIAKAQAAYKACDVDSMKSIFHKDFFGFNLAGGLVEGNEMAEMKAHCEAGGKYNFNLTPAKMHVGDGWAVVAGHNKGTTTSPEGETQEVSVHFTAVFVKEGEDWKNLHLHPSPDIKTEE